MQGDGDDMAMRSGLGGGCGRKCRVQYRTVGNKIWARNRVSL